MKEGELVEQGRHSDLLNLDGEYANLYKLQAEAFMPDVRESHHIFLIICLSNWPFLL